MTRRLQSLTTLIVVATTLMSALTCVADAALSEAQGTSKGSSAWSQRIKHIVVLMEENRSFDHMLGWRKGVNGLNASMYNKNAQGDKIYVTANASRVAACDPAHGLAYTTFKLFGPYGNTSQTPTMDGFVWIEGGNEDTDYCGVMESFTVDRLPVMNALADEFVLMDRFFCSVPGPTWPNRMFFMAGTSGGLTSTGPWYHDHTGSLFPMKTIFKQVEEGGGAWKVYYNDTPWELFMEDLAHAPDHLHDMGTFYRDAAEGTLPDFSFINPRAGINITQGLGSNDQHPDHDITLGEAYYKDVYEALRSSPQWNDTLLVVTYDEHGGFYDHVPTPIHNVPPPDQHPRHKPYRENFGFDRLGVRVPTLLISPWLRKGSVVSGPPDAQKPTPSSEYELTSIMATARKLLRPLRDAPPLTQRDAWAATFEHLFTELEEPRTDCPEHLPDPLPPKMDDDGSGETSHHERVQAHRQAMLAREADAPLNELQRHIATVHAHLAGRHPPFPDTVGTQRHISQWLQDHFRLHRDRVAARTRFGAIPADQYFAPNYTVIVVPELDAYGPHWHAGWNVQASSNFSFVMVSQALPSIQICLDAGPSPAPSSRVGVRECDGGWLPELSQNPSQQWLFYNGAISLHTHPTLCVTNRYFGGSPRLHLQVCDGSVNQHYSWQGPAPGQVNNGHVYFGDDTNVIAILHTV